MRNILCGLSVLLFLGYLNSKVEPPTLIQIQTHFGISHAVAFWIVVGSLGLVGVGAYFFTRPRTG